MADMAITLVLGDITEQRVDAIVNAANSSLLGGGGVDGAIHRRGGPAILAACRELRAGSYRDGLPVGQAAATTAGQLAATWVIHTVGPVYSAGEDRSHLLASCYQASRCGSPMNSALASSPFPPCPPASSDGRCDDAARIAVSTVHATPSRVGDARFVLLQPDVFAAFERAFACGPRPMGGADGQGRWAGRRTGPMGGPAGLGGAGGGQPGVRIGEPRERAEVGEALAPFGPPCPFLADRRSRTRSRGPR